MAKPTNFLKCGILLSAIASLLMLLLCFHSDIIPSAKGILNKQLQSPPARLYPVSRPAEDSGGAEDAPRPEAYITFLKDETDTYYKNARLLIWSLMHDPETRDENRPVIVLTTDRVPREWQLQLAADGADVRKVGWLDGHFDGRAATGRYEHLETKLNIFNQTDFQLLFFIDADHVLFKPLEPVWQDATALPGTPAMMAQPDPGYDVLLQVQNSFNSGFMLIRPSRQIFEELLEVTDYVEGWVDQAILNKYFRPDGPHPWAQLPKLYDLLHATVNDSPDDWISFHEKPWDSNYPEGPLMEAYDRRLHRWEGYLIAKEDRS